MSRHTYSVRLNDVERQRYQILADRQGISLAEWLRDAARFRAIEGEDHYERVKSEPRVESERE
jgi:hypothetical protein